jgi:deazaflavin-dependent oxidoreductase (nitroreductase family)
MPTPIANAFMKAILCSPLYPLLGENLGVISVTGRKTGRRFSTPINVERRGKEFMVISSRSRTWWKNLLEGRPGGLRVGGKSIVVMARVVDRPAEVANELRKYFDRHPGFAKYFGIQPKDQGRILEEDLLRVANDRVIIFLVPGKDS